MKKKQQQQQQRNRNKIHIDTSFCCCCCYVCRWLTELTNWLSTFNCLHRIDLCMWIRYFAAVGSVYLLFFDLLSSCRIEIHWKCIVNFFFSSFIHSLPHFNSIFSIQFWYLIYVIESNWSSCLQPNNDGVGGIKRERGREKRWREK